MPIIKEDCFKCVHKGKCDGYIDRVALNFKGCPPDKQFIPSYTKRMKSVPAKKVKDRKSFDKGKI